MGVSPLAAINFLAGLGQPAVAMDAQARPLL